MNKGILLGLFTALTLTQALAQEFVTEATTESTTLPYQVEVEDTEDKGYIIGLSKQELDSKPLPRRVAIEHLGKGNYYESLVSEVEGFSARFYPDNIGFAIGHGWNVSLQSRATNEYISRVIGLTRQQTRELVAITGQLEPKKLPNVALTPEQAMKAAQTKKSMFEQAIREIVTPQVFDKLKPHQQAVLVYHTYKVGPEGAMKYRRLNRALAEYVKNPTTQNAQKVAKQMTYQYMLDGKVMHDTRSTRFLGALFTSIEAYGDLLGADLKEVRTPIYATAIPPGSSKGFNPFIINTSFK